MPIIPLLQKLKKAAHRNIALAQDIMVIELYNSIPRAVIHGGTAIWRCYGGSRFSEDVDVYLEGKGMEGFRHRLAVRGFSEVKFRVKDRSVFSTFSYLGATVRFEAVFKSVKPAVRPFELSDGTFINVYTLSAEDLIKEKVAAYFARAKVRDLYDITTLLKDVEAPDAVRPVVKALLDGFRQPVDAPELKALVMVGAVPDVNSMIEVIARWVR